MTSRTIGCFAKEALYEIQNKGSPDFLRGHPGQSESILGLESHDKPVRVQFDIGSPLCESPIEREMLAALLVADWRPISKKEPLVWNVRDSSIARPLTDIVIMPQFNVARYRLDFAVSIPKQQIAAVIGVECDGAEFHDAQADFRRDGDMACFGIVTLRFSGADIKRDAARCAAHVVEVAAGWSQI